MPNLRHAFKFHGPLLEWLDSVIPGFMRVDRYIAIRKRVIADPRLILSGERLPVFNYVLIGTGAAFVLLLSAVQLADSLEILPKSLAAKNLQEVQEFESEESRLLERLSAKCEVRLGRAYPCREDVSAQIEEKFPTTDITSYKKDLEYSRNRNEIIPTLLTLFGSLFLIFGSYFFAPAYARFYPASATSTPEHRHLIRQVYLMVLGTVLFYPTIFASSALALSVVLSRIEPAALVSYTGILTFFGGLPQFVAGLIGAMRIHDLLTDHSDWRYGPVIGMFFVSNAISSSLLLLFLLVLSGARLPFLT